MSSSLDHGPSSSAVWTSRIFSTPVSTALKAIGVEDGCVAGSIEKDTLPSNMFANVSESSSQSSRTKHVVTFPRLAGKV